ncbi:MAG: amidophosphoribosyltransferase [Planctomycetes bacterium]|nr:amidophosphoribosyltransferase [Planctomycetota bacterium]
MCGIVGLLLKNAALRPRLGALMVPMFACMADRGPDSAGLAVFGDAVKDGLRRFDLYVPDHAYDWKAFAERFRQQTGSTAEIRAIDNHAILITELAPPQVEAWLKECDPSPMLLSVGRRIDLFKDMGDPREIASRYRFDQLAGTHAVGHTRMATESAVTPSHAHPYTAGEDFCLVHNGSLSNPYMLRRMLEAKGLHFETDNDTEAACRFIEWRMRDGETLDQALGAAFKKLDGFYTLLIATATQLTLVRDPFACKPAVVAETAEYVAVASEFRSLAHLPGIDRAKIIEPAPEEIYSWRL